LLLRYQEIPVKSERLFPSIAAYTTFTEELAKQDITIRHS